jgi:tetratricopeptide (TPR) repeat protein
MTHKRKRNNQKIVNKKQEVSTFLVSRSFETAFSEASRSLSLQEEEKREIKETLSAYCSYHTLKEEGSRSKKKSFLSPFFYLNPSHFSGAFALSLILLSGSAGMSIAATYSLPGDRLYPIKVHINEEVGSIFAFSPEEKVEVHKNRATRRISEADSLLQKGRLNEENTKETHILLEKHIQNAISTIEKIADTDPALAVQLGESFSRTLIEKEITFAKTIASLSEGVPESGISEKVLQEAQKGSVSAQILTQKADTLVHSLLLEEIHTLSKKEKEVSEENKKKEEGEEEKKEKEIPILFVEKEKLSSPHIRERSVYIAQNNALLQREEAHSLFTKIKEVQKENNSKEDTISSLEKDLEEGDVLLILGDSSREEYSYSDAYNAYRNAQTHFTKIIEKIKNNDLHFTHNKEEDSPKKEKEITEEEKEEERMRAIKEKEFAHATLSLGLRLQKEEMGEEISENTKKDIENALSNARTRIVRGNASYNRSDYSEAYTHYKKAVSYGDRAHSLIEEIIKEKEEEIKEREKKENTLFLEREEGEGEKKGKRTYHGTLSLPKCTLLSSEGTRSTENPLHLIITLSTEEKESCEEKSEDYEEKEFSVSFENSEESATLIDVIINNTRKPWEVIQKKESVGGNEE